MAPFLPNKVARYPLGAVVAKYGIQTTLGKRPRNPGSTEAAQNVPSMATTRDPDFPCWTTQKPWIH